MARRTGRAYLVGSGIASLAAASYLIRDGGYAGESIEIFDESGDVGGSLDGHGSALAGYRLRGGRMLNFSYACTYDLLSFVPSLTDPAVTVLDEIRAFNARHPTSARARLVRDGMATDVSAMGFRARDRIDLIEMTLRTEDSLGTRRIDECFEPEFFETTFWLLWATTFAFEPWHSAVEFKRYLHRFIQEFARIGSLAGVDRTPYNQYDSIVRPLVAWLESRGVRIRSNARVTGLEFTPDAAAVSVRSLAYEAFGRERAVAVGDADLVFATLGSMTAGSSWGSMDSPARLDTKDAGGSWALWESLARDRPALGRPDVFDGRIDQSKWISFTMTFYDRAIFEQLQDFAGTALATFEDSSWLLSIVLAHQPHFIDQPANVAIGWGYALFPDRAGDFVRKPMAACSGAEILEELLGHLHLDIGLPRLLDACICLPCMMPFVTSQFLTRARGDRPAVVPAGSTNFAAIGQFCEIPLDTIFTVEYSVRSAQLAVFGLLGMRDRTTPMYDGDRDLGVLKRTIEKMLT